MTIQEIAERVEQGELVKIPSKYFGLFHQQAERLTGAYRWTIKTWDDYFTVEQSSQTAAPAQEDNQ